MGNFNNRLGRINNQLVIFRKSTRVIEPSKRSLQYPTFRQKLPKVRLELLADFYSQGSVRWIVLSLLHNPSYTTCARNYGHFGRQWVEYIRANKEVLVQDFSSLCDEIFATFGNELEPAHVTAICACILAYWHFRKCIGLETSFDLYHAQSDVRIISRHLPTQDEISDVKRWVDLFAGYVGSHPKHFWRKVVLADGTIPTETFYAPTLCGRIFDDSKVAINTTSFKEICAELNIIAEKFINELYEGNYLVGATSKNKAKKIRIGNNTVRAYVFKEGLLWEYAQNNDADSEDDSIQA